MAYFVFAIHTDHSDNRCYNSNLAPIERYSEAAEFETDMRRGKAHGDNYFVELIRADTYEEAAALADAKRPHPKRS